MKFNKGAINCYDIHPMVLWRPISNNRQKQQSTNIIPLVTIHPIIKFSSLCNY